MLDDFLRSRGLPVSELLTEFFTARGSTKPGLDTCNLIDGLSFAGASPAPARVAAFNELLREIPAPVLADLVGGNPKYAAERASLPATDWAAFRTRRTPVHP
jgi:hypothetical protein